MEGNDAARWIIAVVVIAAIVGLVVLARGPSGEGRNAASAPAPVAISSAAA